MIDWIKKKWRKILFYFFLIILIFLGLVPVVEFEEPLSTVLYDRNHDLLSARVAQDEQWRFPVSDSVPERFASCILYFEDEYFYLHPGVNPISIIRATSQNIKAGRVISGGSTLSMQVIRLSRKGKSRSISEKIIEIILALRMELRYSKEEILNLYTSYAPFGGNVVGLEAASWRYYGRASHTLSWGESAALAVLPNAPSIVYPGKSEGKYLKKRNRLLVKLHKKGVIDSLTLSLSISEDLPSSPYALPDWSPHLLQNLARKGMEETIVNTSIDINMQKIYTNMMHRYHDIFSQNEVHNGAILVVENKTKKIRAYVGNTDCPKPDGGARVDIITSQRSTGSLLKPFLYAAAMDDGRITSNALIPDIPTKIAGFAPKNFDKKFAGAVPAHRALTKSLNVPAVRLLREYGLEKFSHLLKYLNLKSINKGPEHYGLSIILGGAESNLFELVGAYSSMANQLNHYFELNGNYYKNEYVSPNFLEEEEIIYEDEVKSAPLSTGAIWTTFNIITELQRPGLEGDWKMFESSKRIAWKTGTSYGFRDAWAIGVTPEYTVGVWIGNASGEGRPHLIGLEAAAPVMFDVFNRLPKTTWFTKPFDDIEEIEVCAASGSIPSNICNDIEKIDHPFKGQNNLKACEYHKLIHLDADSLFQVNSSCYEVDKMIDTPWFVLPPSMEWYYMKNSPNYHRLPALGYGCNSSNSSTMEIIYPRNHTVVKIPRNLDGSLGRVVFEAAHNREAMTIFWHLDNEYLQSTSGHHQIELLPEKGSHKLTLLDEMGNDLEITFNVLE